MADPLDDTAAYDRLFAALRELGTSPGATVRADTALKAARRSLNILMFSLLKAGEESADKLDGVKVQD
ncbi:hypothetical protein GCM10011390_41690 [Aureimonas endophytica]|uniref:Uncharacterized protein n=1 Tax=Aureimonas endophytica TaxID=2027858 RepID=A0A916ZXP0_9HYPH|nr:hypothetical protein [Aureimonas endophytica]GGE18165.1 hypothetical protein GCM10011390_41690 [Aureimonas endophytica]